MNGNDERLDGSQVDVDRLRERYRIEKERRLRARQGRNFEAVELEGRFARYGADPFAPEVTERTPERRDTDVFIVGAGFGGQSVAVELSRRGIDDFVIVDVAGDFGGTWYWNRYPGVRCDIESYIYLPYLEETGFIPSERYSPGSEIWEYARLLGRHFDLYRRAFFQTRVTQMEWDEPSKRWHVSTDRGDLIDARFVITQSGLFGRPQLPDIDGITEFEGDTFHTSRWDYSITGGDDKGAPMDRLSRARVGIVGTGATALQVIPQLAEAAAHVTVFQRTPTQVTFRGNGPTDVEWFKDLPSGWQRQRIEAFDKLFSLEKDESDIDDGWARFARHQLAALKSLDTPDPDTVFQALEASDFEWNEELRALVDLVVEDPSKAALLKAYYRTHCKRPGFSDDYLPAFNRPNVDLVDVVADPIQSIERRGVVLSSGLVELDVLIFATGFDLVGSWTDRAGYDLIGRNGRRLSDKWRNGPGTLHGVLSHGFPNAFFMGANQVAGTPNLLRGICEFGLHIAEIIHLMMKDGLTVVEPTPEAEQEWQEEIERRILERRRLIEDCTPGYFSNEGQLDRPSAVGIHRFPAVEYYRLIREWRERGEYPGIVFER